MKLYLPSGMFYVCIHSHRYADSILFRHEGGIDIGDVDAKVDNSFQNAFYSLHLLF